jgi:hypothetical protein
MANKATMEIVAQVLKKKLDREKAKNKEMNRVINRLGTIFSEEWGSSETEYEDELNHLFEKKTLGKFSY